MQQFAADSNLKVGFIRGGSNDYSIAVTPADSSQLEVFGYRCIGDQAGHELLQVMDIVLQQTVLVFFDNDNTVVFIGEGLDDFITGFTQPADQVKGIMNFTGLVFKFVTLRAFLKMGS